VATILIRDDTHQLELLLRAVVEHLGHEAVVLGREPQAGVDTAGDLLLLDPRSAGAVEGATELRSHDPELPIVCVGADATTLGVMHFGRRRSCRSRSGTRISWARSRARWPLQRKTKLRSR